MTRRNCFWYIAPDHGPAPGRGAAIRDTGTNMSKQDNVKYKVIVKPGGGRDYPILIGNCLMTCLGDIIKDISPDCRVLLVSDKKVAALYLDSAVEGMKSGGADVHTEILPTGERHKNFRAYGRLIRKLAGLDDARDLVVAALGGGVVGDAAGFAAATYRRGIPLIQIPTTLLACVDSSVGGKTAIDLPEGKNLVGAFHQPRAVLADLDALSTLPSRELRAGMAEVIKYGFIMDSKFTARLEKKMDTLLELDPGELARIVKRCCELKAKVVKADERDTKGARAILNFGHTFAHAIETACGYSRYRHGEAVGAGMVCAAELSERTGMLEKGGARRVEELVAAAGLPVEIDGADAAGLVRLMQRDKKTLGGKLRFVLLDEIGSARLVPDVPERDVRAVLKKRCR